MSRYARAPLLAAVAGIGLAAPGAAQHHGHMPGMHMPAPPAKKPPPKKASPKKPAVRPAAKKPDPKKPVIKKPTAAKPARKPAAKKSPARTADPHTGHAMPAPTGQSADPHAGHGAPAPAGPRADSHAAHSMPEASAPVADAHAGHLTAHGAPAGTDLPAGNAPPPPVPTADAADAVYGAEAMAMGRHHLMHFHGDQKFFHLLVNVAEAQVRSGREAFEWDAEAWYGGDLNRLWLKTEGEGEFGAPFEAAEVQALYSRAVGPYFNLQGGFRYDFKPDPSRVYATLGVEGLAPSFFHVGGALFLSNTGELMARAEGSYDQRITQRLILQPRAELNFAAQNSREIGVGAGLSEAEAGLRLRYDIRREFAPYLGVQYRRAFGRTRTYLREEGERAGSWSLLTGVRLWF